MPSADLSRSGASHHPELLIAAAASQTAHTRLGSGSVLVDHYSPFKTAEMFKQLEAMAPGRIDLGMGRATARLGIGYTFAGFVNPVSGAPALRNCRENFRLRGHGLDTPRTVIVPTADEGTQGMTREQKDDSVTNTDDPGPHRRPRSSPALTRTAGEDIRTRPAAVVSPHCRAGPAAQR